MDALVATTGYHRKYAIQVLNHEPSRQADHGGASRCTIGGSWLADAVKVRLRQQYLTLDPAELLRRIEQCLAELWNLANKPDVRP